MKKTDVLILGSGVAGLSTAIRIAVARPDLKIRVITKTELGETNTRYAQGGVSAVWNFDVDSFEKHIADTLDAGDGLCEEQVVKFIVEEGPERVRDLIEWGAKFDKDENGEYNLGMEGGHSENRILHYKDLTGWEIQRTLSEKAKSLDNIEILENYFAINLITQHHLGRNLTRLSADINCFGAYILDTKELDIETHIAKVTIVATGGAGQIYRATTNPVIASGDGIAMVYRAKGRLENTEFVQFHPTSLYNPPKDNPVFLVSEAVRGFGAILKDKDGKEFMQNYDPRKSLAPRDIVARAIDNEMKKSGLDYVNLDCTHLDKDEFIGHFPTIYNKCLSIGIDPMKDFIPVTPACHYFCGGIKIDHYNKTSISNLYAVGECTSSGLHGANRLASNSLLEGLVHGERCAKKLLEEIDSIKHQTGIPEWDTFGTTAPNELVLITQSLKELREIMSSYVGIVRSNVRLKRAMDRLLLLYQETEALYNENKISPQLCELRNLITIAYLVTKAAGIRKESRGLHYTTDYPNKNTNTL